MKSAILATTISAIFALGGCAGQSNSSQPSQPGSSKALSNTAVNIEAGKDYHSFSNPEQISVTHLALDLDVNFDKKIISGDVELSVKRMQEGN
ncbi:MAG: aminopeptidase, partial [Paraglaciecola chathamensis]